MSDQTGGYVRKNATGGLLKIPVLQLFTEYSEGRLMKLIISLLTAAVAVPGTAFAQADDVKHRLQEFYQPDKVQTVHLQVAEADLQKMKTALPKRIYVPATFRWRDVSVGKVAVRYKGNSSSNPKQRHKRSFLVKFNEYEEEQRFLGVQRVSFDNAIQFGSLFSEPIMTGILRDQGITTHRCNYARIYLNGRFHGVYTNVERIDESFIANHLPDAEGGLYKCDLGGPACNLQFIGDDVAAYKKAFELKNRNAKEDLASLVDFIRTVNRVRKGDVAATFQSKIELDEFLRVTAVMCFSGAFDQLTGWNPHNYYLYHDRKLDRWRYLPWDLDVGFCEVAFGHIHVLEDWNAAWPVMPNGTPNPLLDGIAADPLLLARYREVAAEILEKYFTPEHLHRVIDARYALIRQDLQKDPFPHSRATSPDDRSYEEIVASMKTFMQKRYDSARQQLDAPGPRPEPKPRQNSSPSPELEARIQQMQRLVHLRMQRIGSLLQRGRMDEAQKLIEEMTEFLREPSPAEE